ncbi:hypothetical protein ACT80S_00040 [Ramlibacter sp. MAHUQ-53]|uniref:hypothetical protein n=1 Tax=unclassified Ramlibacter TaxID=2617605 RepID=UPI003638011B
MPFRLASKTFRTAAQNAIHATVLAAAAVCAGQAAAATEVGPYFQGYASGSMVDAKNKAGMNAATLAFGVTRGSCAFDAYFTERMPDARAYVAAGGTLAVSLGGADGIYAEISCSDDQLFALLDKLVVDSKAHRIDWDIEGHQLNNTDATARRNRVLKRLQAKYPNVKTSFTLPGWLNGIQPNGMALLKSTIAAGVRIDIVNMMAMTFGPENIRTMVSPSTLGQAVVMTYNATEKQMAGLFPGKTPAQINAMMGITPMIGTQDDPTTFTLADAKTVADLVKSKGSALLAYWAFQRDRAQDRAGITPLDQYSGVVQSDYQFLNIFKTAQGASPAPAPAPSPAPAPIASPVIATCANWDAAKWYVAGTKVARLGRTYVATAGNQNSPPEWTPTHWALTTCSAPAPAPAPVVTYPNWVMGQYYAAGSVVSYGGKLYKARYANPGYNPTISTYYWAPYAA